MQQQMRSPPAAATAVVVYATDSETTCDPVISTPWCPGALAQLLQPIPAIPGFAQPSNPLPLGDGTSVV